MIQMTKIRGIVKAAQTAQNNLKFGIQSQNVTFFKEFIQGTVQTIERTCAEAKITPNHLSKRSRDAYLFLKHIDLDNLPVVSGHTTQAKAVSIRVNNIKSQQNAILQKIFYLTSTSTPDATQLQQLRQTLAQTVNTIENICSQDQLTPASLTSSSRQIYSWIKFLTIESNLQLHLTATCRLRQCTEQLLNENGQHSVKAMIEFNNFAGLYKIQKTGNTVNLTVNEGFINAPEEIWLALAKVSIFGKDKNISQLIRKFESSEEYSDVLLELDLVAQVLSENSQGQFYDLDELFNKINHEYFKGILVKPRLTWSQFYTYRKFGHYERARDRVAISLTLDNARIPQHVIEFVLYHELLHKYHGVKWVNGKRMVHSPEFRREEKKFKWYKDASNWLKKLSSGHPL